MRRPSTSALKKTTRTVLVYLFLVAVAVICIIPFYTMLVNATRTNTEINRRISLVPGSALVDNYKTLIYGRLDPKTGIRSGGLNILRGFLNSAIIAIGATVLAGYFSSLTAYGFAMYRFRGRVFLFWVLLSIIMIPPALSIIGFYKLIIGLRMLDTYWPLVLPAIASPYTVFFIRQYITLVFHPSLMESARIDGAGEFAIFHRIALPLMMPGIATMSIFGFFFSWNSYIIPLTVLNSEKKFTLPLMIQQLNTTSFYRDLGAMNMGIALSVIPIILVFVFFGRYIMEGLAFGGIKE